MLGTWIDRAISIVSPAWAARRMLARATMSQIEAFSASPGGYDAGKLNRLTKAWANQNYNENAIPREQVQSLRQRSWDLFRNNCHARKIVRNLTSKVIGRGMTPQSQAVNEDGTANVEFRQRARKIWADITDEIDYFGRPGKGGQHLSELAKSALRGVILGGETLYRVLPIITGKARKLGLTLPLQLQLISADRLDAHGQTVATSGNEIWFGIELNTDGTRAAYYILDRHPSEPLGAMARPARVPADEIGHVYVADDIGQLRGVPWFAAALMQMRDTGDYQFNELKASAVAACVALGVRRPTGSTQFGLQQPQNSAVTDADGNPLTAVQPGMIIDLGTNGELTAFNPARPTTNAEAWIQHMVRTTATGLPGCKSSTLTGDYRNSSFSSERSADNDTWPEIQEIQDWFSQAFYQPIYEAVIDAAVLNGLFEGIITPEQYTAGKKNYVEATWQGPVALSINPNDDAEASAKRIAGMQSSPQNECSKVGLDWQQNLQQVEEYLAFGRKLGLPEELLLKSLGFEPKPVAPTAANQSGGASDGQAKAAA